MGLFTSPDEAQAELLRRLKFERAIPGETGELFYKLRISGNRATHSLAGDHAEALTGLKLARALGVWFHRTFSDKDFRPGPFVPPPDPTAATSALHEELTRLRQVLAESQSSAETSRLAAETEARLPPSSPTKKLGGIKSHAAFVRRTHPRGIQVHNESMSGLLTPLQYHAV